MKTPFASKSLSQATRRRVDLAIAVAQERLLATHVDHALDLIELVGDRVPFDNALEIYHRLLRLTDDEIRLITTRALAALGERGDPRPGWSGQRPGGSDPGAPEGSRPSLFVQLRDRLRGRINEELRTWIELEAARTEIAILNCHVENALNFVEILEGELPFNAAVDLYLEALEVRDSIAEVVYYFALTRLNPKLIPERPTPTRTPLEPQPAVARGERQLRLVDGD